MNDQSWAAVKSTCAFAFSVSVIIGLITVFGGSDREWAKDVLSYSAAIGLLSGAVLSMVQLWRGG